MNRAAAVQSVERRVERGTMPHAMLITGTRGMGKRFLADDIVRVLLGDGPEVREHRSLDLLVLKPVDAPNWITLDGLEGPNLIAAYDELVEAGFLVAGVKELAGRTLAPVYLDPQQLYRKMKGKDRVDRATFEKKLEKSGISNEARAVLHAVVTKPISDTWYKRTVSIDQMRGEGNAAMGTEGVLSFLSKRPAGGRHKVVVIEEAERMTEDAQNALLKTLEEPPPQSFLILTVTDRSRLLDTIHSRCEEIRLQPLGRAETDAAMREYFTNWESMDRETFLDHAEGVPGRAALLEPEAYREVRNEVDALVQSALSDTPGDFFVNLERWIDGIEGASDSLATASFHLDVALQSARARAGKASDSREWRHADALFLLLLRTRKSLGVSLSLRLQLEEFGLRMGSLAMSGKKAVPA
ncbi:MAG: hypothetical protein HKN20_08125 [Gemmatimonadetes bacterium]|nr:hypothetical protein [Gemmatimonadota bacterium]